MAQRKPWYPNMPKPTAPQPSSPPPPPPDQTTPLAPSAVAALQPTVSALAAAEAPGMKPAGQPIAGQLLEGQILEQPIAIQPGHAYTVVAAASGITELDLQLSLVQVPLPPVVVAQDASAGPTAVLGAGGGWVYPGSIGAQGKLVIVARRGSGIALAQVYVGP